MRLFLVVVLGGLMHAARAFAPPPGIGSAGAGTALSTGYLLLTAFLVGGLFKKLGLPKLTGYLATGIVAGPQGLALVSGSMVGDMGIFNGVAIALIALGAGIELGLREMRPLFRTIGWVTFLAVGGTTLLLAASVFLAMPLLPFGDLPPIQRLAIALVLGVTMVAQSPAVVVAVRDEVQAEGPLSRTVLGVVVVADLLVIVLFTVVSSAAQSAFGAQTDVASTARTLAWELLGSLGIGLVVGGLVVLYLRKVASGGALFVVTVAFVVAEVGHRVHLDPLLVMLAAGILVRNATSLGDRLHHEIEAANLPVAVIFFAVAGATIHLDALQAVGPAAAAFVVVRATGFFLGTRAAARIAGAPEVVRRYGGFGLMPQAGLALALAMLFVRTFPQFGADASALVFAIVALNELVAPVLYRAALLRSGEAGRRRGDTPASLPTVAVTPETPAAGDSGSTSEQVA